jgi:para-nitrobenzyl esterase
MRLSNIRQTIRQSIRQSTNFAPLLAIAALSVAAHVHAAATGPVKTADGLVVGTLSKDGKADVYRGIPFAAPPVGELRWREPQPVKLWTGTLHADDFGKSCMQILQRSRLPWAKEFMAQNDDSEDCLTLNVFTPSGAAGKNLPVLFWIYGGGGVEGSAEVPVYDGTEVAKTGIVVVTINYRLGIFATMTYPELTAESAHHSSGNYGTLDQIAALQWVQKNIAAFGGDPAKVTIDGQSAGAGAVHSLVTSPLAKGLFRGAIAESGSTLTLAPRASLAAAEKAGKDFAEANGAHSLKELRAIPADKLLAISQGIRIPAHMDPWITPEDPIKILAEGHENDVPFITGIQANDYLNQYPKPLSAADYKKIAAEIYGATSDAFLKLYPAGSDAEAATSLAESNRDKAKANMYFWAVQRAKTEKSPTYTYYFTHALPDATHPEFGAFHTGEVPYTFRNLKIFDRPFTPVDTVVSDTISGYWKNFVVSGNPNGTGLPKWTPASSGPPQTQEIGDRTSQVPLMPAEKFAYWKKYFDEQLAKVQVP